MQKLLWASGPRPVRDPGPGRRHKPALLQGAARRAHACSGSSPARYAAPEKCCPHVLLWSLAERDAREGRDSSRVFVRMVTNILLHLAAVDDDVSYAEAEFITDCADRLSAVCDSAGVKPSKPALNAKDFVTSGEPSFIEKAPPSAAAPSPPARPPLPRPGRRKSRRRSPTSTRSWPSSTLLSALRA